MKLQIVQEYERVLAEKQDLEYFNGLNVNRIKTLENRCEAMRKELERLRPMEEKIKKAKRWIKEEDSLKELLKILEGD